MNVGAVALVPDIKVDIQPFVEAETIRDGSIVVLVVYKSDQVSDTDPVYKPVADYLAAHPHRQISYRSFTGTDMLGGGAVRVMYRIGGDQISGLAA